MRCEEKFVFPVLVSFLILTAFASVSEAKTIYVPDDYAKIQWAVDNASIGDTIIVRDGIYYENVFVNKKLTIKSEKGPAYCIVNGTGSTVFMLEADGIRIEGFSITGGGHGIYICNSNKNTIINNNISSNKWYGIALWDSNNDSISKNIISSNIWGGISLAYSNENTIKNNEFMNNGLYVEYSYDNIVEDNTVNGKPLIYLEDESDRFIDNAGQVILVKCKNITVMNAELTNTTVGIELFESDNCLISNNSISSTNKHGVVLSYSNNNNISDNNISSNKWYGIVLEYSNDSSISNNIISSNNLGGIYLGDSNNNSISNNIICSTNKYSGIQLHKSGRNSISKNIISSNNGNGIYLYKSDKNSISKNNIRSNKWEGIDIGYSNDNIIYLNNFINNTGNVYSYYSTSIWNSTEQITYTYRGSEFTNYMGNYWDDYNGSDANGDGIGDTPYSIDSDKDNYPLMERFEHYFVPTPSQTFDTGRPENPYPSISGKFIGTIKTNKKIIATKLYTYACEGTGGHTEHALICNKTWCAYAEWDGYKEDWMNISFNRTVILMPHETYNITIVTGSYPQIHHTHSLKTENGWINCTEFIDANGNKYEDWIPAIMLWS